MQVGIFNTATFRAASIRRLTAAAAIAFLASLFLTDFAPETAQAESRMCKRLSAQLASLPRGGAKRSSKRVQKAIRGQLSQIKIAKRRIRQLGCSKRRLFFFRDAHPSCGRMRGALQRMRNNLDALRSRGGSSDNARSSKRQRAKIHRAMNRNRCGESRSAKRSSGDKGDSIVDQIFSNKSKKRGRKSRRVTKATASRTICVRTCDGYFFPVNFSTKRGKGVGVAACEQLCPGTEMRLYYDKAASDDPAKMISVATGQPYSALPNAFTYQESFNPNCSCNYRQSVKAGVVAGDEQEQANVVRRRAKRAVQKTALPIWRPDGAADPETAANRRGDLDLTALGTAKRQRAGDQVAEQRRVRVVGETFLPAQ
ncbi:MAG: DUF2865 domain-containing protein [Boseongicola sp.]